MSDAYPSAIYVGNNPGSQEIYTHAEVIDNILTIESKNVKIFKVEIYSILGEKIKEITSNFGSITTDKLPKGIYIIRIYTDKSPILRKIIKI